MTDTPKSEARFSLDDVIVIRTPNDCKMCERRVNTYVENVKDWQRQYDEILAKHERVLKALEAAEAGIVAALVVPGRYEAELREKLHETLTKIEELKK